MALDIATQVAAGLAAVHKKKLVRRDIKPSDIMVSFEEEGAVSSQDYRSWLGQGGRMRSRCSNHDLGERGLCRNPGVRQSRTNCRRRAGGCPFGSLLAWCFALADADRSGAISGYPRRCLCLNISTLPCRLRNSKVCRSRSSASLKCCSIKIPSGVFRRRPNF